MDEAVRRELPRRLLAEFLGSAFLAAVVVGSGIAAQRLSPDDTGLALLENAAATAAGLFAIILMFGAVTVGRMFSDTFAGIAPASAPGFIVAQLAGGVVALGAVRALYPDIGPEAAAEVVVPRDGATAPQPGSVTRDGHRNRV